jgi:hypothetical protein
MIGWATIGYGAALSGVAAGALVAAVAGGHRLSAGLGAAAGATAGAIAWNAILRATHADTFFTDAPICGDAGELAGRRLGCVRRRGDRGAARPGPAR